MLANAVSDREAVTTALAQYRAACEKLTTLEFTAFDTAELPDMIRLGAHAHHYFLLYRHHTAEPLYLGRTKRLASKAQRLVAYARDRGCTKPGCFRTADHCQANHVHDWAAGGHTNADTIVLGCGPDNLTAYDTGWTNRIRPDGRAEWIPPPLLNTGQDTVNHHFHPEELLNPPDTQEDGDDP